MHPRERLALLTATRARRTLRSSGIQIAEGALFFGKPLITTVPGAQVRLGRVRLVSASKATPLGINHAVVIRALGSQATIEIGDDSGLSGATICSMISVKVGRGCLFGANVTVVDTDFHPVRDPVNRFQAPPPEPVPADAVVIEDNVFLGTGSIVLKGVTLGANSVVGAGSVVTKSFPANSIVAGNPARQIGTVQPQITR